MNETIEMLDGRVYQSADGWATVRKLNVSGIGGSRVITGKEADVVRLLAAHQAGDPRVDGPSAPKPRKAKTK